jgi:hypothetical protein
LESYKDLADDTASLKAELKASEAALNSERSRVKRQDKTIRYLKDEIAALKQPPSTVSTTTLLTQPIAQSLRTAGPSSRPTAPLPTQAHSGLSGWLSNPGLASHISAHPEANRVNDTPGNLANDVPKLDTAMPDGWESDPNWALEVSVWDEMRGPGDPPKPLSKKRKKRAHDNEPIVDGWTAAREKAMREYLMRSTTL